MKLYREALHGRKPGVAAYMVIFLDFNVGLRYRKSSFKEETLRCQPVIKTPQRRWSDSKSRKENPQKLTQLSSRSHPRHLVGKRAAQKDITIDTTSDSQVNSNFPNRWSPASLTFNNYFYLFLYLYITWITTINNAPHLKSPKNQKQKSRLGTARNKNYWGALTSLWSTNPRPWFCLGSSDKTIITKASHHKTRTNQ